MTISADWVTAIASLASAVTVAVTAVIFLRQLSVMARQNGISTEAIRAQQKAFEGQTLLKMVEMLAQDELRKDRKHVVSLKGVPLNQWTNDDREKAERVIRSFDIACLTVYQGMLPIDTVIFLWGYRMQQCWSAVRDYFESQRNVAGPSYMIHFTQMLEEANKRGVKPLSN